MEVVVEGALKSVHARASRKFSREMQKVSSGCHASVGSGDDGEAPGREVLVGTFSGASSARAATATSSTCTEADGLLLPPAQGAPVAVPSMKGEMCACHPQRCLNPHIFVCHWRPFFDPALTCNQGRS